MLEPVTLTVEGACTSSGLGRTKIYSLIGAGLLDARKADGRTLILAASLRHYLENLPPADIRTGRKDAA